jgi:nanoRNase/pAp phosphatase (c-di-AMP/oligoRNAs hydrolase)
MDKDNKQRLKNLMAAFAPEDKVLIAITADPDAVASALAMKRLLWRKVAQISIAHHNVIHRPDNLAMIRLLKIPLLSFKQIKPNYYNKVVMLDSQPHHSRDFAGLKVNVIIDHHPPGPLGPDVLFSDIRAGYGANSTIMLDYLKAAAIRPSERLATALSYGIRTDTALFIRANLEHDVKAFFELYPNANAGLLRNIQSSEMRINDLKFLHEGLGAYTIKRNCAYLHLAPSPNADTLVQLADFFMKVDTVDMAVVSGVIGDNLIIIMRYLGNTSRGKGNIGKLASEVFKDMGTAGGHATIARAELPTIKLLKILPNLQAITIRAYIQDKVNPAKLKRSLKPALTVTQTGRAVSKAATGASAKP